MWSRELAILLVHTSVLVARTFISIYVARLEGTMVKFIVQKDIRLDKGHNIFSKKYTCLVPKIEIPQNVLISSGGKSQLRQCLGFCSADS